MQPPPRKGNYAKFLKNLHAEQVAKLQLKNQNECELLEDIRNFILKRSAIEKSYAEALLKISSAFLNRKIPNIPDLKTEGSEEKWNMWNVWRTVLEENEKLAKARLAAVEVFSSHVADDAKLLRANKLVNAKRLLDQLAQMQKEVQTSVLEVDKAKKAYFDEEHSAHDVRDKARDIEEKLKKKKGSFFQSITSLQKNSAKVTSKREQLEEKSSGARNDYLLALAAANAHQTRYFVVDFQNTILALEANVYEKVAEYLLLIARAELLTCTATQTSFNRIKEQSAQLTREYNLQCVYLYYPVLKQHIQYEFDACDNDGVRTVTVEHSSSAAALSKEAKRWAGRIARESATIRDSMAKLQTLHNLRESGQKTDPNDPNGPDIETKMDELRQTIRRAETSKAKAEARIECLRQGGVNVDEFLQDMENLSVQDIPRSGSSMSVRTDASGLGEAGGSDSMYDSDYTDGGESGGGGGGGGGEESGPPASLSGGETAEVDGEWAMLEQERQRIEQLTAGWDDPTQVDWGGGGGGEEGGGGGDEESAPSDGLIAQSSEAVVSYKCTALYSYTAQNPDELSIVENEQLEVVGEGDGDGWLRARNYRGEEGYVPHNYLDVEREEPWSSGKEGGQLTSQISFSSVDYTVDEEPSEPSAGQETVREAYRPPDLDLRSSSETWCIALYDYEATCPEELSFLEGDIIKILRKVVHEEVDDGWWEGQRGDEIGLFPSLVVEECREDGQPLTPQDEDSPPDSAPPVFTPPDLPPAFLIAPPQSVIITQPTPLQETNPITDTGTEKDGDTASGGGEAESGSNSFSMDLSGGQRKQYDTQFGGVQISVSVTEDDDASKDDCEKEEGGGGEGGGPDFGLSSCSVVITAATPMIEEAEKPFPPPAPTAQPPTSDGQSPPSDAQPSPSPTDLDGAEDEPPPYAQKVKVFFKEHRSRSNNTRAAASGGGGGKEGGVGMKFDPYETDSDHFSKVQKGSRSTTGAGDPLGGASRGTEDTPAVHHHLRKKRKKKPKSPARVQTSPPSTPPQTSRKNSIQDSTTPSQVREGEGADSAPFPASSSTGSDEEETTCSYTGPSTAENSAAGAPSAAPQQPAPPPPPAVGSPAPPPSQSTKGKTDIPDELEPHQLARLQDLKESDA